MRANMQLFDLVRIYRGKEKVMATDSLPKINAKKKSLLDSQRNGIKGQRVEYVVRPSQSTEKLKKKPNTMNLSGQGQRGPRPHKWGPTTFEGMTKKQKDK
jgi:hypothetical protein